MPRAALDAAKHILVELEHEPDDAVQSQPVREPETGEGETIAAGVEVPEHWDPERATAEVWSGENPDLAQFLLDVLHENGIGCRTLADSAPTRLFVCPEDADTAREIIREVLEGTPPG